MTKKFFATYDQAVLDCQLHLGVQQVLDQFKNSAKQQYVLTAAHKNSVLELLEHFDIHPFFEEVEGLDNHRAESKVERGLQLVRHRAIRPADTVLIGDTTVGQKTNRVLEGCWSKDQQVLWSKDQQVLG